MSCQKGNGARTRPQKYKNSTAFKNNLHDTTPRVKLMNSIQISNVCLRCKEIIDWKIKYKKYKPLKQPKTCTKCDQKTITSAYHIICVVCAGKTLCCKCGKSKELVPAVTSKEEQLRLDNEMKNLLASLPERKKRSFLRYMNKLQSAKDDENDKKQDDLRNKLEMLKVEDDEDSEFDSFDDDNLIHSDSDVV